MAKLCTKEPEEHLPIEATARYCYLCGSEVKEGCFACIRCGKELSPFARFCPYCGSKAGGVRWTQSSSG